MPSAVASLTREAGPPSRTVLVVCSHFRDHRELGRLAYPGIDCIFHDYASTSLEELIGGRASSGEGVADPFAEADRILAETRDAGIAAVVSTDDYPGAALAAILAKALGLPGPEPKASLICQQKYLSRLAQRRIVPEATPPFAPIDVADGAALPDGLSYPLFVKPVKSFFSIGAQRIESERALLAARRRWLGLDDFFLPLERMLARHAGETIGTKRLIAEGLLKGAQVTVEGYVHGGEAHILGVVDSIFYPGTLAFSRFDYPSALPQRAQDRMAEIAGRLMPGIGFDNGIFNIEMMYDPDTDGVFLIEINPRMASQFADLYEKVDGTNSYEVLIDLGLGKTPRPRRRQGAHRFASSIVLRTFGDCFVTRLPGEEAQARLAERHPDMRIEVHATQGRRLSDELQDDVSYRYGIVNLGGDDLDDVLARFEDCRTSLGLSLVPAMAEAASP